MLMGGGLGAGSRGFFPAWLRSGFSRGFQAGAAAAAMPERLQPGEGARGGQHQPRPRAALRSLFAGRRHRRQLQPALILAVRFK